VTKPRFFPAPRGRIPLLTGRVVDPVGVVHASVGADVAYTWVKSIIRCTGQPAVLAGFYVERIRAVTCVRCLALDAGGST